jgi:hypothetical protein
MFLLIHLRTLEPFLLHDLLPFQLTSSEGLGPSFEGLLARDVQTVRRFRPKYHSL